MSNNSPYPKPTPAPRERSFKIDARAQRDFTKKEWASLLRDLFPGRSDAQVACEAAELFGVDKRTASYWLAETTAPEFHHAKTVFEHFGVDAVLRLLGFERSARNG